MKRITEEPCPGLKLLDKSLLDSDKVVNIHIGGTEDKPTLNMILLRRRDSFNAFVNRCSHFGVPLNVLPDHTFYSEDNEALVCQVHYAKYSPHDGRCLSGDCLGEGLEKIEIDSTGQIITLV